MEESCKAEIKVLNREMLSPPLKERLLSLPCCLMRHNEETEHFNPRLQLTLGGLYIAVKGWKPIIVKRGQKMHSSWEALPTKNKDGIHITPVCCEDCSFYQGTSMDFLNAKTGLCGYPTKIGIEEYTFENKSITGCLCGELKGE